jgi:glutathionyl-hydroquinone reductase
MGVLIDGTWRDGELPQETGAGGEFRRADSSFRDRITADGSSARPIDVIGLFARLPRYQWMYLLQGRLGT